MMVKIFTDGACSGNPGPGGWAYVLAFDDTIAHTESGCELNTTNNRMELQAVVEALDRCLLKNNQGFKRIDIYSDSAYVVNCVKNGYLKRWSKNGWKNHDGVEIKHIDLWARVLHHITSNKKYKINFIKIKGHKGILENELADMLAKTRSNEIKHGINKNVDAKRERFLKEHI